MFQTTNQYIYIYMVNYNNSLTWIVRPFGMIILTNHDSSEGEQWGRYNSPRYIHTLYIYIYVYIMGFYGMLMDLNGC